MKTLCYIPESNKMLYINYTSIKKKKRVYCKGKQFLLSQYAKSR